MYHYIPEYDLVSFTPGRELSFASIANYFDYLTYGLKKNPKRHYVSLDGINDFNLTYTENMLVPELSKQLEPPAEKVQVVFYAPTEASQKLASFFQLHNPYDHYQLIVFKDLELAARHLTVPEQVLYTRGLR